MGSCSLERATTALSDALLLENPPAQIEMILKAVRLHLGMDVAFISEVFDGKRLFRHVDADGAAPIRVGGSDPLYNGYCGYVLDGRLPKLIPDTAKVALAMEIPATSQLPVGAHLSVPIRLSSGLVYGTFCCFSFAPDQSLNERDLRVMEAFAAIAAQLLESDQIVRQQRQKKLMSIETAIDQDQISIAYQPIYRVKDISAVGFECLARFSALPSRPPNDWFSDAAEVGLGAKLEVAAIQKALNALCHLPADIYLAVNVSPATITSPEMATLFVDVPVERIILEITEHDLISDYSFLLDAIAPLQQRGLRVAVDDAGAGYASLRHILRLRPDVIKVDATITRGVDSDPGRYALIAGLVTFANVLGSHIVAEGVETDAELETLRKVGVQFAQGFLLGKPRSMLAVLADLESRRSDQ